MIDYGTLLTNIFEKDTLYSSATTASTIGTIIAVVAVLEIHIERNAVVPMKPTINLDPATYNINLKQFRFDELYSVVNRE